MAFTLFGKRRPDSEPTEEGEDLEARGGSSAAGEPAPEKRGFFDRMKQAVSRTRDSFSESIGSVLALTREIDETSLAELEIVLLAADIGGPTARTIIENLRQRGLRQGIEGGAELKRLLKIELKQVLDGVATTDVTPPGAPEVVMMVGVNGTGKTTTTGKLAAFYRAQGRTVLLCAADTFRAAAIEQLEVWASRSDVPIIKTKTGGEGPRDRCADRGHGRPAAYQDRPDEGAGQDAADSRASGPRSAPPDPTGDGCDYRTERPAAGAAVYRGCTGDRHRAD
jgi:fused signal recognition particle receptor